MLFLPLTLAAGQAAAITCPADAVAVGPVCVDKYEASVWAVPNPATSNKTLVAKLKKGTVTLGDLAAGGATQLGCDFAPFDHDPFPPSFPPDGNWSSILIPATPGVYAASVPGVLPSACITWFQSQQACLLSDKRLLTNAEWQAAAAGTPDPGTDNESTDCNVSGPPFGPSDTGSRSSCKSNWGASDMAGNIQEWVADWVPASTACPGWGSFSDDLNCFGGASETFGPGALFRGGGWAGGAVEGIFKVVGSSRPSESSLGFGLRCAR
jgi:formylglycine-generating enzyme required for sulfatase activity